MRAPARIADASVERELEAIAQQSCDLLRREVPEYAGLPSAALLDGTLEIVRAASAAVSEDRPATSDELTVIGRIGEICARSGVPFHALVRGLRMAAGLTLEISERRALESGAPPGLVDPGRLWPWVVEAIEAAAAAHRQVELEMMREDRHRRVAFLTDLFASRLSATKLVTLSAEFGLDPDEHYLAFRARIATPEARRRFEDTVEGAGLAESHQGELVGVLAQRPRLTGDGLVAIGQRLPLASAAFSFSQASTVLRVASAFGLSGVVSITDIPLQAAVLESANVTGLVTERCLGAIPGHQHSLFTQTLTAYLDHNLHIAEAATALHVHPNTLRYRIRRFEELSGLHLERVDDLVLVWWALQYARITHPNGPAAA
jgi:hypothetical protein